MIEFVIIRNKNYGLCGWLKNNSKSLFFHVFLFPNPIKIQYRYEKNSLLTKIGIFNIQEIANSY